MFGFLRRFSEEVLRLLTPLEVAEEGGSWWVKTEGL